MIKIEHFRYHGWGLWRVILSRSLIPARLQVIWWAILGRPIIYRMHFLGGIKIDGSVRNALIANNVVENRVKLQV